MSTIPQTPIESLYHDSVGVWDSLKTPALAQELITRRQAYDQLYQHNKTKLYHSFNTLLSTGNHDRLILYIPLTLIPKAEDYRKTNETIDNFIEYYIQSWHRLLLEPEPRANITNGDIDTQSPPENIIPAAYLAPTLLKNGLITPKHCNTNNTTLSNSFTEALTGQLRPPNPTTTNPKRTKWLNWETNRQNINKLGQTLAPITDIITTDNNNIDATHVTITAIRTAIEQHITTINTHRNYLTTTLNHPQTHHITATTLIRLYNQNLITHDELHNIQTPTHTTPLSQNLQQDQKTINQLETLITHDPQLTHIILPIIIIYGSRYKGYSNQTSDLDIAIFIRPQYRPTDPHHQTIKQIIQDKLPQATTYWLHTNNHTLHIHNLNTTNPKIGTPTDANVLFNGVWIGDNQTKETLCQQLLKPLTKTNRNIQLRELEKDLLQYRLLHRGYETYYNPTTPTFLDEGYRHLATKLYLSYIFLP